MKNFIILLAIYSLQVSSAHCQIKVTTEIPATRKVLHEAVTLWLDAYTHLKRKNYIGIPSSVETSQVYYYSQDDLNALRDLDPDCPNLSIRIYLDADSLPHFGLVNCNSGKMIVVDHNNNSALVDTSIYNVNVENWLAYLNENNSTMAHVRSYTMAWTSIDTIMGEGSNFLRIDPVAHTLSPYDTNYQVSDTTIEGFIAIDVLLTGQAAISRESKNAATIPLPNSTNYYDFAMPCPKNCPER